MKLVDNSNNRLQLDSLSVSRTYEGVLVGRPSPEEMVQTHLRRLERTWGPRKTLLFPWKAEAGRLPDYCVAVWFSGSPTGKGDGSELVLVWFSPEVPTAEEIQSLVGGVDWRAQAQDYEL